MKCPKCGNDVNGKFCPDCGAALTEQPVEQNQEKPPKKKKKPIYKRVWFWIVIGIIVIGIIGGNCGGKSSGFSDGFEAGMEAAKQTAEPQQVATEQPAEITTAPTSNDDAYGMDVDGEFGLDINGNYGPDRIALITYAEMSMEDILKEDVEFLYMGNGADSFDISKSNLRYIIKGNCKVGNAPYEVIVKLEFDEAYETYAVFQLKLDGKNIDF